MTEEPLSREPTVLTVREGNGDIEIDLDITPDLPILRGHFPGFPIVPGVAQIDWVLSFAHRYLGTEQKSARRFNVKFRAIIQPETRVTLVLGTAAPDSDGARRLAFTYRWGNDVFSSGQIWLEPPS